MLGKNKKCTLFFTLSLGLLPACGFEVADGTDEISEAVNIVTSCGDVTETNAYQKTLIALNGVAGKASVSPNNFGFVKCKRPDGSACVEPQMCLQIDDTTGDFEIISNVWDSEAVMGYGDDQTDPLNYPNLLQGKNWDFSTAESGMPLKVRQVASWPIGRDIESKDNADDAWNASFEWWFTTYDPSTVGTITQPDATELMIWQDSFGLWQGNPITPYGKSVGNVNIEGLDWEVIIGRAFWGNSTAQYWNYIVYRPANGARFQNLHVDAKKFFDDAKIRQGKNEYIDSANTHSAHCKNGTSKTTTDLPESANSTCLNDDWYVMSIQVGFEVYIDGVGLKSTHYSSTPNGPVTSRTSDDGKPIVFWGDDLIINATGCPDSVDPTQASATYSLTVDGTVVSNGDMGKQTNGYFSVNLGKPWDQKPEWHGASSYTTTVTCGTSAPISTTIDFYVDQSGIVIDQMGKPIVNAEVTLYRSDTATGTFTAVPNGSTIMAAWNRKNPDHTVMGGYFGWDVTNGFYKVRAEKTGCVSAANPSVAYAETAAMSVPPPVTNIKLQLICPVAPSASIVNYTDWGTGYCADVTVKNTTEAPWAWNVTFPIDGTIYDIWSATYTISGDQVTLSGLDWNRTLAVGASTQGVGFCANRTSTPSTPAVAVTKTSD